MKTSKIFKKAFITSCALLVPFCELMAEAQDEKVYTAKYKFNYESTSVNLSAIDQPVGTSFSYSGSYKRAKSSLLRDWRDRVYLDANNEGKISIYKIDDNNEEKLLENTEISVEYSTEKDKVEIQNGIRVNGKEELNKRLEDFE